mmetsp:Transcript_22461/g.62578  ORF Transcript_22461/g.62578 Transcript_22461/m.62578 type:complete len:236 (-) Transcript_22461:633-1340(-)
MMMFSRNNVLLTVLMLQNAFSGSTAFVVTNSPVSRMSGSVAPTEAGTFSSTKVLTTATEKTHSSSSLAMGGVELVDPSYNLAIGAFGIGLACGFLEDLRDESGEKLLTAKPFGGLALIFTVFSLFLAFQTTTLRFAFDEDSFSLVQANGAKLEQENVVVGGENKWRYDSFKNYDFLPSRDFPILVYFREDQTPVETREEVPIVVDNLEGQVHFFPAISNSKQLEEGFAKHGCPKV